MFFRNIAIGIIFGVVGTLSTTTLSWGGEGDLIAAADIAEDISNWIHGFKNPPKSIGIFSIKLPPSLDPSFANVFEAELVKYLQAGKTRVVNCPECRTPRLKVKGERILITKGAPDLSTFMELGNNLEVEAFLALEVDKTKLSMITHATVYEVASGKILGADAFKASDLDFVESAMQYNLSFGPGFSFGKAANTNANPGSSSPPLVADFSVLEELSFGKGGFNVGSVFNAENNNYFYFLPTVGFRFRWGHSSLHSLITLGAGYGTGSAGSGGSGAIGINFYIGSFTFIGVKTTGIIPFNTKNNPDQGPLGTVSLQIGLSLGK